MTDTLSAGISHVGLSVSDIDASVLFFGALGFAPIGSDESYPSVFLSDGNSVLTLWKTDDGAVAFNRRKNVGLHHLAIKVASVEALDAAYDAVCAVKGTKGEGDGAFAPEMGGFGKHAMVFEPSGNRIELSFHA